MEDKVYSAKTLSDAITDACAELGLTSDKLDYKIVQEGKNGFFGIGAKPYIISVRIKSQKQDTVKTEKSRRENKKIRGRKAAKQKKTVRLKIMPEERIRREKATEIS